MKVKEVMTAEVVTVVADAALKDAAQTIVDNHIAGVPVVDLGGTVIGVLSEADIVAKQAARQRHQHRGALSWLLDPVDPSVKERAGARTVREAMSTPAITIAPEAELSEAAARMVEGGVNRLPVVSDGMLVGIITHADLVRAFARPDEEIRREIEQGVIERVFWLGPTDVTVSVDRGVVELSGRVETENDVQLLPELVQRVPGVVSVAATLATKQAMVGK